MATDAELNSLYERALASRRGITDQTAASAQIQPNDVSAMDQLAAQQQQLGATATAVPDTSGRLNPIPASAYGPSSFAELPPVSYQEHKVQQGSRVGTSKEELEAKAAYLASVGQATDATRAVGEAEAKKAEAEAQGKQGLQSIAESRVPELRAQREADTAEYTRLQDRVTAAEEKYKNAKITSWWDNKSTGDRIMAAIAVGLGTLGSVGPQGKGKDAGLEIYRMFENAAERHRRDELARIDKMSNEVAMARAGMKDALAARAALREQATVEYSARLTAGSYKLEALSAGATSDIVRSKAAANAEQMRAQANASLLEAAAKKAPTTQWSNVTDKKSELPRTYNAFGMPVGYAAPGGGGSAAQGAGTGGDRQWREKNRLNAEVIGDAGNVLVLTGGPDSTTATAMRQAHGVQNAAGGVVEPIANIFGLGSQDIVARVNKRPEYSGVRVSPGAKALGVGMISNQLIHDTGGSNVTGNEIGRLFPAYIRQPDDDIKTAAIKSRQLAVFAAALNPNARVMSPSEVNAAYWSGGNTPEARIQSVLIAAEAKAANLVPPLRVYEQVLEAQERGYKDININDVALTNKPDAKVVGGLDGLVPKVVDLPVEKGSKATAPYRVWGYYDMSQSWKNGFKTPPRWTPWVGSPKEPTK